MKTGSHYRVSEVIPCIYGVLKKKIEREMGGGGGGGGGWGEGIKTTDL